MNNREATPRVVRGGVVNKAEELAQWLERGYPSPTEKNIAAHLRALDASHQRLKEALEETAHLLMATALIIEHRESRQHAIATANAARAALEQARGLS